MQSVQRSISFDQELWSKIDRQRGDVSRSRFIAKILADIFDTSKKGSTKNSLDTKEDETK